jgi:carbon-monoxide dehydrogenase medium subunit
MLSRPKLDPARLADVGEVARVECRKVAGFRLDVVQEQAQHTVDEAQRAAAAERPLNRMRKGIVSVVAAQMQGCAQAHCATQACSSHGWRIGPGCAMFGPSRSSLLFGSMKDSPMRYEAPGTLDQAVALLAAEPGDARVLAGGTDLLVQLRTDLIEPALLVDIKRIPELRQVTEEGGGFRIGAAVTGAELKEHPKLKSAWPGVVEAANLIGSTQVQGRATLGGNLCNGSPAADSVPALIAAGALAFVAGPNGRRELPVEEVMLGPRRLALAKGEILTSFLLPAKPARTADAYLRFIPRTEMDIAVAGCGVCLMLDAGGRCTAARVALGAVAPRPLLVPEGARALVGSKVDGAALERLDAAARAACQPIDDKRGTREYRTKVAGVLARRAVQIAYDRARRA